MIARCERAPDRLLQEHGAHREASRQGLRDRDHTRHDAHRLVGEERSGAPQAALHLVEDEGGAARVAQLAQPRQPRGIDRMHATFPLHRLDDHRTRLLASGAHSPLGGGAVAERDDRDSRDERLEGAAVLGTVRRGERREQAPVEPAAERHDPRLPRPLAGELEGRLVRLRPGVAEEHLVGERAAHELLGEALARLRAVEVGYVDQPRREGPLERPADHGMIVAQRVDADAGHEVEVAYAVLGDELGAVAARKHRADASVHAEQCRSGSGGGGHAGCAATASTRVPADDRSSRVRSPMRTARAPAARADLAARSFAAMPSRATPAAIRLSISVAAISGWGTPPTTTPGTSETNSSSAAARAPATAAAA